ncbi:MAG: cob(I)yrinic acid a,c-diamide adenosyltransferase [Alphaproteobacteria bacterium]|nr:MAG: cob(I)yrinic acid a,c-diamide adenosyltransferase [Alphaproteobacteria bacterium]
MVKLDRIYTRGGDRGATSLVGGQRLPKDDPLVAAYGTIDEANAAIGLVRAVLHHERSGLTRRAADRDEADGMLARIQNDLFDLGADLATPWKESEEENAALRITDEQVTRLEHEIDTMTTRLEPLTSFVLPGGSRTSAHLHLARTIVRRAERAMVTAMRVHAINPQTLRYVNRLSDHLFVLARLLNDEGRGDVLWKPGANR